MEKTIESQTLSQKTIEQYEEELINRIKDASFIINGLDNYGPYNKIVDMFKENRQYIDDHWHLVNDPAKINELRISKMACNTLINFVSNLKMDREKFQIELGKLTNPDDIINKDYDNA